jgi:squalene synthase HpnD
MNNTVINIQKETAQGEAKIASIVRRSGSSFFYAMRRLPEEKRIVMYAIYAFCREVDDIADEPGEIDDKKAELTIWRDEVERLYAGQPSHLITKALLIPVKTYGLQKDDFMAIIDGMEIDAEVAVRIATIDELELYCDRVASAVGRLSVRVFGVPEELGIKLAFSQGQALQLTNILRDVHEDVGRNRIYLPQDLLMSHGIKVDDLDAVIAHPALADVCEVLSCIAQQRYREVRGFIKQCDRDSVRPAIMMMEVYSQIFQKLTKRGWTKLTTPVGLTKFEKIWIAIRYGIL